MVVREVETRQADGVLNRHNGLGSHDHEGLPPPGPEPRQPDPEQTIRPAQLGPVRHSLVHGELVAQGEVFEGELTVTAAEEREEAQQVEQRGHHELRLSPDQRR